MRPAAIAGQSSPKASLRERAQRVREGKKSGVPAHGGVHLQGGGSMYVRRVST